MLLTSCTNLMIKPDSINPRNRTIYTQRGGDGMLYRAKTILADRGWDLKVGKAKGDINSDGLDIESVKIDSNTHYYMKVKRYKLWFVPLYCMFNGGEFWVYNVSIANNQTGEELLIWDDYGCADSSAKRFNELLDILENN